MRQILGGGGELVWVAVKAALLYLTALFGLRVEMRRTIAEISAFDFIAAVAVGAIVGRVPNASDTSYLAGAVTLVTLLILHNLVARMRFFRRASEFIDHPPRLLVAEGRVLEDQLHRSGLTRNDLYSILRQRQITDLGQVAYMILEQRGHVSVFRSDLAGAAEGNLVREVIGKTAAKNQT